MAKTRFHAKLEEAINEEIAKVTENIVSGGALDHGTYRNLCGYIHGLRGAIALAERIEQENE